MSQPCFIILHSFSRTLSVEFLLFNSKTEKWGVFDLGKGKFDTLGYKEVSFQPLEYLYR